jgi:hypothetical protein
VALADGAVFWAARGVDKLYAADAYWLVAAYAEPWRTGAVCTVAVVTLAVSVIAAGARPPHSWREFVAAAGAMCAGFAVSLELTRAVHFNGVIGELYVHMLVFRRAKVSFASDHGGRCVHADVSNPFVWRLNGSSIRPRLLPVPYESTAVVGRLLSASSACVP